MYTSERITRSSHWYDLNHNSHRTSSLRTSTSLPLNEYISSRIPYNINFWLNLTVLLYYTLHFQSRGDSNIRPSYSFPLMPSICLTAHTLAWIIRADFFPDTLCPLNIPVEHPWQSLWHFVICQRKHYRAVEPVDSPDNLFSTLRDPLT